MGFIFNFVKWIIKTGIKLSIYLAIFITVIVLIPNLPPYTKVTSIELAPTKPLVGPLALNTALNNAEQRFKGKLLGPEAFQTFNGELYTSLGTGEIVKVSPGGHITFVTKIGQPCTGIIQEHICGRPLGFQIDEQGKYLYVVDTYHGIWKVDLKTDKKQLLVSPRNEIEKRAPKMFNSIVLGTNGDFYWTDSSSDFQLNNGALVTLADPSGRLFYYNAAKNESKVLLDDLWLANGLTLSPNKEFIVVAESMRFRLTKYYLAGPKKGKSEAFVDGLPGTPDNVRALPDGSGVLVGLYSVFNDEYPMVARSMAGTPVIRKFLLRLQMLLGLSFEKLNSFFPNVIFEEIIYGIGHFKSLASFLPPMSGLVQIDWNGNIVATYYTTDGSSFVSDAIVYNDKLYLGSPHKQDYIGVVPAPPQLKKAFETTKPKTQQPKEEPKPKVAKKPKEQPKPKVQEQPKKVEQKPVEQPKPKVAEKPKDQPKPKTEEKPKVESPKVVKPAEQKPAAAKPVESAKPAPTAAPTPKPQAAKPAPPKAETQQTTPKPAVKTTPKPTDKATPPPPKPTTPKPAEAKPANVEKPVKKDIPKAIPEQIPIKEDIPSDTAKPKNEKLKVIKKGGPTEIPVHNL